MVISIVLGEVLFPHGLKGISTPVFNDSNCTNNTAGVNKTCTYTKSELSQRLLLFKTCRGAASVKGEQLAGSKLFSSFTGSIHMYIT